MSYANINRVVLVGRLTRDPETRATTAGQTVCALRIACNGIRRESDGTYGQRPNYFDVSVFGPAGENVERYLHKGARVAIDGRLEWREWETDEQQRRQAVSIVAESVEFLDSPGGEGASWDPHGGEQGAEEGDLLGVGAGSEVVF